MPKAAEIAEIAVNGQRYRNWQTVTVERSFTELASSFAFTAASPIESAPNWSGLKLRIGDDCQVFLAGRQVINGNITGRQPAYDANQHGLQIVGKSLNERLTRATVDSAKGEFKKYNLSQIANSVMQPFGLSFRLEGATSGAELPFEKVNVQRGETVFALIERLCRMRNIHLVDDAQGNVIGFRGSPSAGVIGELAEGRNIKAASAVFNYEHAFSQTTAIGQRIGNNDHWGDDARDTTATIQNPAVPGYAPNEFSAEMPGSQAEMKMRAQHELAWNVGGMVNVTITVQGWHKDDGSLWLENVGKTISVVSPMLFTDDVMTLAIDGVSSTQNEAGTTTTLALVLPDKLVGSGAIGATAKIFNPGA